MSSSTWAPRIAAVAALTLSLGLGAGAPALADPPTHAKGVKPGPSELAAPSASDLAADGPHAVTTTAISGSVTPGFGAATIYAPASGSGYGGVAISPGYMSTQSAVSWLGPRLASHGFVVITFDTTTIWDNPDSRGVQLLAALDYLTGSSPARGQVDASRLAVMGHSMGGGGSLAAAKSRPSIDAAIPLTPWHTDKTWPEVSTPTLIVGAENDGTAPVASHAEPFYESLATSTDRAYLELNAATHSAPNSENAQISTYSLAWLKRFVDGDTSVDPILCPGPAASSTVEEYRSSCPF